jgi:phosphoribosylanthranilate isomerase
MPPSPVRPRVKICCIASVDEAWLAIRQGASALGLVSAMPSGPGPIAEELIADIASRIPPGVASVLLTSRTDADAIIDQQRRTRVNTLQLVDALPDGGHARLRDALPGVAIIQVIHVTGVGALEQARRVAPDVDALLLDSGNPALAVKELGGTGRTHDWAISRRIVESVDRPVFLAGGLHPDNVAAAIRAVRPYGVDVCSGLRPTGPLDPGRVTRFFDAVAAA